MQTPSWSWSHPGATEFTSLLSWCMHCLPFLLHTCRFTWETASFWERAWVRRQREGGKGSDHHREPNACQALCPTYRGHAVIGSPNHSLGQLLACPFYRWQAWVLEVKHLALGHTDNRGWGQDAYLGPLSCAAEHFSPVLRSSLHLWLAVGSQFMSHLWSCIQQVSLATWPPGVGQDGSLHPPGADSQAMLASTFLGTACLPQAA